MIRNRLAEKGRADFRALTTFLRYDRRVVPRIMFEAEEIAGFHFAPTLTDFVRPPFRKFEFRRR